MPIVLHERRTTFVYLHFVHVSTYLLIGIVFICK